MEACSGGHSEVANLLMHAPGAEIDLQSEVCCFFFARVCPCIALCTGATAMYQSSLKKCPLLIVVAGIIASSLCTIAKHYTILTE